MAARTGVTIKALTVLGEMPLLTRVVSALRRCPQIGVIVVVGPKDEIEAVACNAGADIILEEGETGPQNVLQGFSAVSANLGEGRVLVAASDLPWLNPAAITSLIASTQTSDADIVFPVISRAEYERVFPTAPNVWTPLREGEFTGGSVLLMRPAAIERNRALIERVFAARKSQWQMARLLGLSFALRFKLGRLSIPQAEARASFLTGCRCLALRGAAPYLAADVDDAADYEWAESVFCTSAETVLRVEGNR